ncbi:MAG: hypothetical protein Kow0031_17840 [Anaerolineae bacterium]
MTPLEARYETETVISLLNQSAEQVIELELQRLFNRANLDDREQQQIAAMSHQLVRKIFHHAHCQLKAETTGERASLYCAAVRRLFALDQTV